MLEVGLEGGDFVVPVVHRGGLRHGVEGEQWVGSRMQDETKEKARRCR